MQLATVAFLVGGTGATEDRKMFYNGTQVSQLF